MPYSYLRRLFAFAAVLAAATLVLALAGRQAQAGTLQVRDEARVLAPDDVARLRSVVASAPFDGRLVLTSEYPDMQDLSRYVGSLVSERDQVVVGVDRQHHHVQVHFGAGASIPVAARLAIERAGNDAFRRGDWEGGAAAIFREAAASVTGVPGGPVGSISPQVQPSAPGLHTALLVLLGVLGIGLLSFLFRRRTAPPFVGPPGPGYGGGPPYQGGGYGYGPQQGGGMGPLGGGLLGAGLGGLAGYELGKMEGERERNIGPTGGGSESGGGNFDAGGGGSDWDDGGGGGGGGFDGGGGDSGGGGSDF